MLKRILKGYCIPNEEIETTISKLVKESNFGMLKFLLQLCRNIGGEKILSLFQTLTHEDRFDKIKYLLENNSTVRNKIQVEMLKFSARHSNYKAVKFWLDFCPKLANNKDVLNTLRGEMIKQGNNDIVQLIDDAGYKIGPTFTQQYQNLWKEAATINYGSDIEDKKLSSLFTKTCTLF